MTAFAAASAERARMVLVMVPLAASIAACAPVDPGHVIRSHDYSAGPDARTAFAHGQKPAEPWVCIYPDRPEFRR